MSRPEGGARVGRTDRKAYGRRELAEVEEKMRAGGAGTPLFGLGLTGGGDDVKHICPECGGGPLSNRESGLTVVETCPVCQGVGTLTNDQMDRRYG